MSFTFLLLALSSCLLLPQGEDLRELSGLSESDAAAIEDNQTLDPSGAQFKKLLYRTGTVDGGVLRQWAKRSKDTTVEQVAADPAAFRFHPFSMDVKADSVHRFDFAPEDAKDFLSGFYIANCQTKTGEEFILISRSSVSSWPLNENLPQPQKISFDGFFVGKLAIKLGQLETSARPVFVARRFAWYPDQENESLKIDAAKVALAKAGVDISLLDIVKSRKGEPIGNRESICYWQMLAACKSVQPVDSADRIDFATMLRSPLDSVGKFASVQGRVRQCVPVKLTSPDAMELLGTDTWYQLTIFPDLDGRPIEVGTRGDPEVYKNAFPVTVCAVELPEGYDSESIVGNTFQYNGFFYRIWSYPSERTESREDLAGQPSPLMMASSMVKVKSTTGQLQTLLGSVLLAMALAVGFVVWFVSRAKKTKPRSELPDQIEAW